MRPVPIPRNPHGPKPRVSWNANARLLRCLWDDPCTIEDIVEETGLAVSTVRGYVMALRKAHLVTLVDLQVGSDGRRRKYLYQWKPDAKDYQPKKLSQAERQQRYRKRQLERQRTAACCFINPLQGDRNERATDA